MGRKLEACAPLGRAGSPSSTMWLGRGLHHAKFHLDPSNHLATIHQSHRQDRQTGQTDRQQSDSIGRNILQTVAQKPVRQENSVRVQVHEGSSEQRKWKYKKNLQHLRNAFVSITLSTLATSCHHMQGLLTSRMSALQYGPYFAEKYSCSTLQGVFRYFLRYMYLQRYKLCHL